MISVRLLLPVATLFVTVFFGLVSLDCFSSSPFFFVSSSLAFFSSLVSSGFVSFFSSLVSSGFVSFFSSLVSSGFASFFSSLVSSGFASFFSSLVSSGFASFFSSLGFVSVCLAKKYKRV
jgi:deoxyhypusine synthase